MKVVIKRKYLSFLSMGLLSILFIGIVMSGIVIYSPMATAGNVTNQTVIARVNVSNNFPTLYQVKIDDPVDQAGNIDLGAGNATTVICNGSFSDQNGFDDVTSVNATLYHTTVTSDAVDLNITHYSNTSCETSCSVTPGTSSQNGSCLCQFAVQY